MCDPNYVYKKDIQTQVFSCDIWEIFTKAFFTEHVRMTATDSCKLLYFQPQSKVIS